MNKNTMNNGNYAQNINENYAQNFLVENSDILRKIESSSISKAIDLLEDIRLKNNNVFVIGNGGSASTASHFANDLFRWASGNWNKRMKVFSLVENPAVMTGLINDFGWENVYYEQLRSFANKGDLIVAFSVHGGSGQEEAGVWSQNLTKAIQYIHNIGGKSIGITGFDGGIMKTLCNVNINVPCQSTPIVEGSHLVISHLIADGLRQLALPDNIRNEVRK